MKSPSRVDSIASRPTRRAATLWLWLLVLATAGRVEAQAIDRPADEPLELPPFEEPQEEPELQLPPEEPMPVLPPVAPEPGSPLSSAPGIFVSGFRVVGSTVFDEETLQQALAPYRNRELRSEDLVSVRNAITRLYLDAGYVNSGATLPDQELEGGVIEIVVVEGRLDEILIAGNEHYRADYLRSQLRRGAGVPLDVHALQRQIRLLQLDPGIRRVRARLLPGEQLGRAVLQLEVEEAERYQIDLGFDNHEPPPIGAYAGRFGGHLTNLVGVGDGLHGEFAISEGLHRYEGRYSLPISPWSTRLFLDARYSDADVVEAPFDELDIESTFQAYQIGLVQPVYDSPGSRLDLGVIAEWRRTRTELGGQPFAFPGSGADQDGRTIASVLRFFGDWLRRDQDQVMAARLQISWGIDALSATTRQEQSFPVLGSGDDLPDAYFVSGLLQVQWARRLPYGIESLFRTDLQLSNSPLFPMERMAIGGYASVRGYRENQEVRDQGVVSSFEVRVPLLEDPEGFGLLQLAPFVDFGHVWDHPHQVDDDEKTLASVGVGLRWTHPRWLSAQIYWGQKLEHVPTSGNLQDDGVHFQIRLRAP